MAQSMPPERHEFVAAEIAAGHYDSVEEMQLAGLELLKWERDDAIGGIANGLTSMERGDGIPLNEAFEKLRKKLFPIISGRIDQAT